MKNTIKHIFTLFLLVILSGGAHFIYALDTTQDPIKIYTAQDLADFATWVNGTSETVGNTTNAHPSANAILMADIDFTGFNKRMIGANPRALDGKDNSNHSYRKDSSRAYSGTFDGNGHSITINLSFTTGESSLTQHYDFDAVGLFCFVNGATIQNLSVGGTINFAGAYFSCIGGIVGSDLWEGSIKNPTTIKDCQSTVTINGAKKGDNSTSSNYSAIGGIMGKCYNCLVMSGCTFTGSIVSKSNSNKDINIIMVGGLIGQVGYPKLNGGTDESSGCRDISDCHVIGATINSSNSGWGGSSTNVYLYPLVGTPYDNPTGEPGATISDCTYNYTSIQHKVSGTTTKEFTSTSGQTSSSTSIPTFRIYSKEDMYTFQKLAQRNNKINGILYKCIEYDGATINPTNGYQGTFDGQGHTITLSLSGSNIALFYKISENALIKNLITAGSIKTNNIYAGGIVSECVDSKIYNCISKVSISNSYIYRSSTSYVANVRHGGIVGKSNNATIENCAFIGSLEWVNPDPTTHTNLHGTYMNGITGTIVGSNSYFKNCYVKFNISDGEGKAFHWASAGVTVENCYYLPNVSDHHGEGIATPEKDFTNGKLCHTLNVNVDSDLWFQKIGDPNDLTPSFAACGCNSNNDGRKVYKNEIRYCVGHTDPEDIFEIEYSNTKKSGSALYKHYLHQDAEHTCCSATLKINNGTAIISNELEFVQFAELVKKGQNTLNAIVTNNLDLTTCSRYNGNIIGTSKYPYKGTFDGSYHTINVNIIASSNKTGGLFGEVNGAIIKNIIVSGSIDGNDYQYIGGIVGFNTGTPATFEKCMSIVDISRDFYYKNEALYIGGILGGSNIAGWNMSNCAFAGSLSVNIPSGQPYKAKNCNGMVGYSRTDDGSLKYSGTINNSFIYPVSLSTSNITNSFNLSEEVVFEKNKIFYLNESNVLFNTIKGTARSIDQFRNGTVKNALNGTPSSHAWYHHSTNPGKDYPTIVGYEWTGSSSSDWNTNSNWTNNEKPVDELAILNAGASRYPIISSNIKASEIYIAEGASITIEGNGQLTVDNTITNLGSFSLDEKAILNANEFSNFGDVYLSYGDAYMTNGAAPSFIVADGTLGNVTVNRTITPNILFYAGSATEEGDIQSGFTSPTDYMSYYDAPNNRFVNTRQTPKFAKGLGIGHSMGIYSPDPTTTFTQNGTVASSQPREVSFVKGWNWLSNPYPFAAKVEDGLMPVSDKLRQTLWLRINNGNAKYAFMTYNVNEGILVNGDGSDEISIAPFQCYCIYAKEAVSGLQVKGTPVTTEPAQLKSSSIDTRNILRLYISTNGQETKDDEAVIVMREGGEEGESDNDSYKQLSNKMSQISLRKLSGSTAYAVGIYPDASDILDRFIPIVINPVAGAKDITISARTNQVDDNYTVSLYDDVTKETVDLRTQKHIMSVAEGTNNRLFIVLSAKNDIATGIKDVETANDNISAFGSEQSVIVLGDHLTGKNIEIVDISGRTIYAGEASGNRAEININNAGIYIVKVAQESFKVMVK